MEDRIIPSREVVLFLEGPLYVQIALGKERGRYLLLAGVLGPQWLLLWKLCPPINTYSYPAELEGHGWSCDSSPQWSDWYDASLPYYSSASSQRSCLDFALNISLPV